MTDNVQPPYMLNTDFGCDFVRFIVRPQPHVCFLTCCLFPTESQHANGMFGVGDLRSSEPFIHSHRKTTPPAGSYSVGKTLTRYMRTLAYEKLTVDVLPSSQICYTTYIDPRQGPLLA